MDGGTFQADGFNDLTFTNNFTVNTPGGTIDDLTILTLSGRYHKRQRDPGPADVCGRDGFHRTVLSGNNTYSGGSAILATTVQVTSVNSLRTGAIHAGLGDHPDQWHRCHAEQQHHARQYNQPWRFCRRFPRCQRRPADDRRNVEQYRPARNAGTDHQQRRRAFSAPILTRRRYLPSAFVRPCSSATPPTPPASAAPSPTMAFLTSSMPTHPTSPRSRTNSAA